MDFDAFRKSIIETVGQSVPSGPKVVDTVARAEALIASVIKTLPHMPDGPGVHLEEALTAIRLAKDLLSE